MLEHNRALLEKRLYSLNGDQLIVLYRAYMGYSDEQIITLFSRENAGDCFISKSDVENTYIEAARVFKLARAKTHAQRREMVIAMFRLCKEAGLTLAQHGTDAVRAEREPEPSLPPSGETAESALEREAKERLARAASNVCLLSDTDRSLLTNIAVHGYEGLVSGTGRAVSDYRETLEHIIATLEIPKCFTFNMRVRLAASAMRHAERSEAIEVERRRVATYARPEGKPHRRRHGAAIRKVKDFLGVDVNSATFKATFEANLSRLVHARQMTMATFAKAIGKAQSYFYGLRHDQRTLDQETVIRCAEVLGVRPETIVTDKVLAEGVHAETPSHR
jgi:hypothetical protein